MTDARPFPTLPHAMAALDELPIAADATEGGVPTGVDYDALVRARRILPYLWPEGAGDPGSLLERVVMTPQGGVGLQWARGDSRFELTIDPFALYAFRLDTASTTREWTRATIEQAVADARSTLGLPALTTPVQGPAVGASSVVARTSQGSPTIQ
ncbi:MAG: hypothetical protein ACJ8AO_05755 [Gemmatimonadaceae bacterium]